MKLVLLSIVFLAWLDEIDPGESLEKIPGRLNKLTKLVKIDHTQSDLSIMYWYYSSTNNTY